MFSAWKIVKDALTSGIFWANEKPSLIRACFTDSTNGAMLILTAPSETSTASLVFPGEHGDHLLVGRPRRRDPGLLERLRGDAAWSTRSRTKFSMALLSGIANEGSTSPAP